MSTIKKYKYEKPTCSVQVIEVESALAADSGKALVTFGRDEDGIPYLEDPNIELEIMNYFSNPKLVLHEKFYQTIIYHIIFIFKNTLPNIFV
ncbi:hypothetical protein [Sphingobacterium bovisgrunnientis]|jgi:hypothetical protein|uniref:hypothetical protein n=1 Tax=Sphingobacterium bovisgrunnientis TaxID=1874697 RepID=UPI00135A9AAC|nr:hypothetical protein [Sphingobacterium bovisgrunnientis]